MLDGQTIRAEMDQRLVRRLSFETLDPFAVGNINSTEIVAGNGTAGAETNMLNTPRGIFADLSMTLYVADCYNDRVQMFRADQRNGSTVAGNGSLGTIALNRPVGVILDRNGYLFVADALNDRIVAEGPNGPKIAFLVSHESRRT